MSSIPDITTLTSLANLPMSEERAHRLSQQLQSVVELMDDVRKLDLEHTAGTNYIIEEVNVLRDDIITSSFTQAEALSGAKKIYNGYIVVPPVLAREK